MKNKAKRIVSAVCAMAMCAAMVPAAAFAEEPAAAGSTPAAAQYSPEAAPANWGNVNPPSSNVSTFVMPMAVGETQTLTGGGCHYDWYFSSDEDAQWNENWSSNLNEQNVVQFSEDSGNATVTGQTPGSVTIAYVEYEYSLKLFWLCKDITKIVYYKITVNEPQQITVNDAMSQLPVTASIDGNELGVDGNAVDSNFKFELVSENDPSNAIANFSVTIPAGSTGPVGLTVVDGADTALPSGDYIIQAVDMDNPAWTDTTDTVTFTVDGQNVTLTSEDKNILSVLASYTVTYNDGVDDETIDVPQDDTIYRYNANTTVSDDVPSRQNYEFQGWDADGDKKADYRAGATLVVTGNMVLKAVWAEKTVEPSVTPGAGKVEINKVATDLVNDQSDVTLSIGADQKVVGSDVVFVLDKSTSTEVKNEAKAMLEELMDQANENGLNVKVGVVTFNRTANNDEYNLELSELNADTYQKISDIFNKKLSSGTNMEAGIRAGKAMLDADDTVFSSNKHLVLVSDGVTYMWGTGETPQTVYVELGNTHAASVDNVNQYYEFRSKDYDPYKNAAQWMATAKENGIENVISEYSTNYTSDSASVEPYIPASAECPYSSLECAIYMAGKAWQDAADAGYQLYAYIPDDYATTYTWASNFVYGLSTIGGTTTTLYNDTANGVDGMFNNVQNSILYAIQNGTVTDVIGSEFDVADLNSFKLTVGGVAMTGTVNGNTVSFDDGNYKVNYQSGENEKFTWTINVPVESAKPVQLTYTVKLVNKATVPGSYTVETNKEAYLDYTSTTGGNGHETFPAPQVTYSVSETTTTTATATPAPTATPATTTTTATAAPTATATPAATNTIPQTSDELPLGALIVVAIVAAGAVGGLTVLRKRREQ